MLTPILGLNTTELCDLLVEEGEPSYRGRQLAEWVYRRGACELNEMTNLSDTLKAKLETRFKIGCPEIIVVQSSKDGTIKLLLEMDDGARVETVGLPYIKRLSCCVSTQVGCSIGCVFCATGLGGFIRNLSAGEIVGQVLSVQRVLCTQTQQNPDNKKQIDHVTFMGMGEPLFNYESTIKAISLLNFEMGIGMRNITISTVGYVPGILKLAKEKLQITLAISLHAPDDNIRKSLIPGLTRWSVGEIVGACREYIQQTKRRVTFEYCLLNGANDSEEQAFKLAGLLKGINCHVNLIPFNAVQSVTLNRSTGKQIKYFRNILESAGITVTQRVQRGSDIDAACGQLKQRTQNISY